MPVSARETVEPVTTASTRQFFRSEPAGLEVLPESVTRLRSAVSAGNHSHVQASGTCVDLQALCDDLGMFSLFAWNTFAL